MYHKLPPGIPQKYAPFWNEIMNRRPFNPSEDISKRYLDELNQLGGQ
jgi:hypothetical protein